MRWLVKDDKYRIKDLAVGTFTFDLATATGDVSYTGVGFVPRVVLFMGSLAANGNVASWGIGKSSSIGYSVYSRTGASAGTYGFSSSGICITGFVSAGNSNSSMIKTMDSDGFTLTWTKTGAPTGTISVMYLAIK
jgi:hypothetical protein